PASGCRRVRRGDRHRGCRRRQRRDHQRPGPHCQFDSTVLPAVCLDAFANDRPDRQGLLTMSHGTALRYEVLNLGGGHVDGLPPEHIEDTQAASLVNWLPFGSKLRHRDGTVQVTTYPYTERITSLFPFKVSLGTWLLIAGTQTGLAKLVAGSLVAIPITDGGPYVSS